MHVAEVLGHGQRGQGDPQSGAGWFVHLTEDERGVLEHACLGHLMDQVIALAGALPHAGEHRGAAEVVRNAVDHLLDQHGLADARATEQADLAAGHVGGEQVEHFDACLQHLGLGLQLIELRSGAMDGPALSHLDRRGVDIEYVASHVPHMALGDVANRH